MICRRAVRNDAALRILDTLACTRRRHIADRPAVRKRPRRSAVATKQRDRRRPIDRLACGAINGTIAHRSIFDERNAGRDASERAVLRGGAGDGRSDRRRWPRFAADVAAGSS